jgi:hypothetical protein
MPPLVEAGRARRWRFTAGERAPDLVELSRRLAA